MAVQFAPKSADPKTPAKVPLLTTAMNKTPPGPTASFIVLVELDRPVMPVVALVQVAPLSVLRWTVGVLPRTVT